MEKTPKIVSTMPLCSSVFWSPISTSQANSGIGKPSSCLIRKFVAIYLAIGWASIPEEALETPSPGYERNDESERFTRQAVNRHQSKRRKKLDSESKPLRMPPPPALLYGRFRPPQSALCELSTHNRLESKKG